MLPEQEGFKESLQYEVIMTMKEDVGVHGGEMRDVGENGTG